MQGTQVEMVSTLALVKVRHRMAKHAEKCVRLARRCFAWWELLQAIAAELMLTEVL
jgi:hypothetical protein